MFSKVKRVEIEIHSYCNRKCPWCPNGYVDRSFYKELDEEVYLEILRDLKRNNFDYMRDKNDKKRITIHRFFEPLSNAELVKKRVIQGHEIIPKAEFSLNTNGDFLSPEVLDGLYLESLYIMDYDCKGREYWLEKFKKLNVLFINERDNLLIGTHKNINKVVCCLDWPKHAELEDRAGFLPEEVYYNGEKMSWKNNRDVRREPCLEPTYFISIDYNGNVMPCCHMRSDIPRYSEFILGNVYKNKLSEIFSSEKAESLRKLLYSSNYSQFPSHCRHCQKTRDERFLRRFLDREEIEKIRKMREK